MAFYDLKAKAAAHTFKVADIAEQSPCRLFTSGQNERTGVGDCLSDPQQVQQVNKLPAVYRIVRFHADAAQIGAGVGGADGVGIRDNGLFEALYFRYALIHNHYIVNIGKLPAYLCFLLLGQHEILIIRHGQRLKDIYLCWHILQRLAVFFKQHVASGVFGFGSHVLAGTASARSLPESGVL